MRRVNVPRLLELLNINATPIMSGRKLKALCPSPDHDDNDPSWTIIVDDTSPKYGSHHCFACKFGGGPWELVAAAKNIPVEEAGEWIYKALGGEHEITEDDVPKVVVRTPMKPRDLELPWGVQIPSLHGGEWFVPAFDYLIDRGIPDWQIQRWHIGFATKGSVAMRVVVPVVTRGKLMSYVARTFINDPKRYDTPKRTDGARPESAIFGEPGFDPDVRTVTIAEGVFSMRALERAGAPNPCAILGASALGPVKYDFFNRFERVLIATDPDKAGDLAASALQLFCERHTKVEHIKLDWAPDDYTDELLSDVIAKVL
jgi:DNA primase